MTNFAEFYASGGIFMHAVSLTAVAALVAVLLHGRARRLGDDDPKYLRLADRLLVLCVGLGLLGSVMGLTEVFMAVSTVAAEAHSSALAHGMSIVPTPMSWALLCAIPVWITSTVQRHRSPAVLERSTLTH